MENIKVEGWYGQVNEQEELAKAMYLTWSSGTDLMESGDDESSTTFRVPNSSMIKPKWTSLTTNQQQVWLNIASMVMRRYKREFVPEVGEQQTA